MQLDIRTSTVYLHTRERGTRTHRLHAMDAAAWRRELAAHDNCKCRSQVACLRAILAAADAVVVLEWADGARYLPPVDHLPYRGWEACSDTPRPL